MLQINKNTQTNQPFPDTIYTMVNTKQQVKSPTHSVNLMSWFVTKQFIHRILLLNTNIIPHIQNTQSFEQGWLLRSKKLLMLIEHSQRLHQYTQYITLLVY